MPFKLTCTLCNEVMRFESSLSPDEISSRQTSFVCPACKDIGKSWKAADFPVKVAGIAITYDAKKAEKTKRYLFIYKEKLHAAVWQKTGNLSIDPIDYELN